MIENMIAIGTPVFADELEGIIAGIDKGRYIVHIQNLGELYFWPNEVRKQQPSSLVGYKS
jgi:hypothetical protein